ncbi:MAG: hypothetical protein ACRDV1_08830 [Actinomycetes bacterium]
MSRQRALRRAERERAAELARAHRARLDARAARRRARTKALTARIPVRTRWRGHQGLLARRRKTQNAFILGLFLLSQLLVWLLTGDPWLRTGAALLGVLSLPVLVTLVLDRSTRP